MEATELQSSRNVLRTVFSSSVSISALEEVLSSWFASSSDIGCWTGVLTHHIYSAEVTAGQTDADQVGETPQSQRSKVRAEGLNTNVNVN